jgi:hypothetical protein
VYQKSNENVYCIAPIHIMPALDNKLVFHDGGLPYISIKNKKSSRTPQKIPLRIHSFPV